MFLVKEEEMNETVILTNDLSDKEITTLIENNTNFILKQETYFKQETKKGLIRIAIFTMIFLIIGVVSLVQLKNYGNLGNISHILLVTSFGMMISLFLSLDEIPTAYKKHKLSATKISTLVGAGLAVVIAIIFAYAGYNVALEEPPGNQMFFSFIMIAIFSFSPLVIPTIQIIGLIISYAIQTTKRVMKLANLVFALTLVVVCYLFDFYFITFLSDLMLLLISIIVLLIQPIILGLNIYIFNKYSKSEILVTPLRILWIFDKKIDYYRLKDISKIEFSETKAIISTISGIIDVKEINLPANEGSNKIILAKLELIIQNYLTKAQEERKLITK